MPAPTAVAVAGMPAVAAAPTHQRGSRSNLAAAHEDVVQALLALSRGPKLPYALFGLSEAGVGIDRARDGLCGELFPSLVRESVRS